MKYPSLAFILQLLIVSIFIPVQFAKAQPDTLWTRKYGGYDYDWGYSVLALNEGGYILTGCTASFGGDWLDVWLIRTDATGDTLWTKVYGGGTNYSEAARSIDEIPGSGYIIVCNTTVVGLGNSEYWILRTNLDGDTLWTQTYGGMEDESGDAVQLCADGGFILAGSTESFGSGLSDFWLVRTDMNGDTIWTRTYGGSENDVCRSAQSTVDGGYILAGSTKSFGAGGYDLWLVKTDDNGDTLWTLTLGGYDDDYGHCVRQTADEGYIVTGHIHTKSAGYSDVWLVRLGPDVPITTKGQPHTPAGFILNQNYPNPFNPSTTFQFELPKAAHVDITIYSLIGEAIIRLIDGYLEGGGVPSGCLGG